MTSTAVRINRLYNGTDSSQQRVASSIRTRNSNAQIESRRTLFDRESSNSRVTSTGNRSQEAPKASLLKYEVRKLVDLRKVSTDTGSTKDRPSRKQSENKEQTESDSGTRRSSRNNMPASKQCVYCEELKEQLQTIQEDFENERKSNEIRFLQFEQQLEQSLKERDEFSKSIKKSQREIRKLEKTLDEEKVQTRRLGIKLEDANYEIGRLRQELINSQLENEKIIEENEDLGVDNEDLIKERDEIIQVYDELYRESERLKHEVTIWKSVFQNNKENFSDDVEEQINEGAEEGKNEEEESDEEATIEIEEDKSLLLPHRHDIKIKVHDPNKTFDMAEELGRGKFGKVFKVVEKSTGDAYAAKYVKVTSKLREDVLNTVEIMKKIHNIRLMNLFDVYDLGSQIIIVLEYVSGGMLFERIVEKQVLTEADCKVYVKQILQGLHHLHTQNICHLELKPENIYCANRKTMDIKIIDFGLAKQLEHKKDIKITAGSPEFVAPEILSFDPVSLASDMWSVGVVAYILLCGLSPFIGDDDNDTLLNVSCGEYEFYEREFKGISNEAKEFIDLLLVSNPKKRGKMSTCLYHPWMKLTPESRKTKIKLDNMKKFLEKRKEKHNVSAVRAIRRFSSFGVGPGALNPRNSPLKRGGSSRHLTVPSALQSAIITEDEEEEDEEEDCTDSINKNIQNGPEFRITRDSADSAKSNDADATEDTDTPDGLRLYLQRMISEGHLPGGNGPPQNDHSDDER